MSVSIQQVQPPLEFIPPAFNPVVLRLMQLLMPGWQRFGTQISEIEADRVEVLADLYQQFQTGKVRFMMAFRHPSVNDPVVMANLLWQKVPQAARQHKIPLQKPTHAHFIYDRGIPLWAGQFVGPLYSRLGCTPIQRGKIDRAGLKSIRELFANGPFPMAAAPEGATNGHNEVISPLEPGIAQMGFWCAEDLAKAGRSEAVWVVPIGIQYRYVNAPWQRIEQLLGQLEAESGLTPTSIPQIPLQPLPGDREVTVLYARLYQLGEHLLTLMEQYYSQFYNKPLIPKASPSSAGEPDQAASMEARSFANRLQNLLDVALQVAEEYFDLQPKGSVIDRCRRLEQAGWERIYREDIKNLESLSPLERGLADRLAEEASLRMWHMRLVESFVAVTGKYVLEKPTVERFAETALLIWDMITRIKGGNPFYRPQLGSQRAYLKIGEPISISARWETYQSSRRNAKQAVTDLTQDIQTAFEAMIF
ncbi:MAG: 1-acyl-sn-glycerol-3-phosphate acyltransferase [Leptolyngbyaceae cyanobacterium bins.59]|nr:1-acyl-sn-glycerol-3-phosphate acyltransferase [Leptolyngbyaceae cyanobacterium bins.59]